MLSKKVHQTIYVLVSALLVISLPVSYFLLSLSIILLAINWVLEVNFYTKFQTLKNRKSLLLLLSIYAVHVVWMINTRDFANGLHDLRIKLPLLILPLILGTSPKYTRFEFKLLLLLFIGTVFVSSIITSYVLFGFSKLDPVDTRNASLFISHIRFSLMVVLSIYSLFYILEFNQYRIKTYERYLYSVCLLWLICFLILLQSSTGIVIFLALLPVTIIWWGHLKAKPLLVRSSYIASLLIIVSLIGYVGFSIHRFNQKTEPDIATLETHTVNGNAYLHYPNSDEFENEYPIWLYISEKELEKEWNRVSEYKFDGLDRKNQSIQYTLVRYLTSMGLPKDSLGFSQLTAEDIDMIEKGYTNYIYKNKFALYPRIYEILWQLDQYQKTGNPSGQSLGQRIEYFKVGLNIVKRSFWLGNGTGDVKMEFQKQYDIDKTLLKPELRHRAHNQFLTFLISFGIFGLLWVVFALIAPVFFEKKYTHFLLIIFLALSILSMFNEDTLETHVGVSFISFFYSLFLLASPDNVSDVHEKT